MRSPATPWAGSHRWCKLKIQLIRAGRAEFRRRGSPRQIFPAESQSSSALRHLAVAGITFLRAADSFLHALKI